MSHHKRNPLSPLNIRNKRFVDEYLFDLDSTRAAIRCGYKPSSARIQGFRLMQDPRVKKLIHERQARASQNIAVTQERILQELAYIAFSNLKDIVSIDEDGNTTVDLANLDKEQAAALTELVVDTTKGKGNVVMKKVRFKVADKIAALTNLGKHLGMFKDQVEHTGKLTLEQLVTASLSATREPQTIEQPVRPALTAQETAEIVIPAIIEAESAPSEVHDRDCSL
jgi:phage terminase small subunit